MTISKWTALGLLLAALLTKSALAYDVITHEELSKEAYSASNLQIDPKLLIGLGKKGSDNFPNSNGTPSSIVQLFKDGANFEDNFPRSTNHFFNPYNGQALSLSGVQVGNPSPDWALEDKGQIVGGLVLGGQEFSYRDGRSYFYLALTSSSSVERDKRWGQMFQTLGQVIHHVQDMAQPQHVRNDQHLELRQSAEIISCVVAPAACATYLTIKSPSAYEAYTTSRNAQLQYSGYAPVYSQSDRQTFNTPRKFWHTEDQTPFAGKGLAEFTNQNFVSAGTNFDASGMFAMPIKGNAIELDIKQLLTNTTLNGTLTFWGSTVKDNYTKEVINNPFASTQSIFDADLKKKEKKPVYSLNRFNYDAANALLIPRAVGYSAGMINYFFRGEIDLVPDPVNAGNVVLKNLGPEDMKGTFTLYYDAVDGNRYPVAGDAPGKTWTARTIAANGQLDNLSFIPPANPAPEKAGEYMLVFNGDMGEEKAVNGSVGAVVAKLVSTPNNGTLYIAGQDSAGAVRYFKVDRSGVALLQSNEFNPFAFVRSFTDRVYHYKQAEVTSAPGGALAYRTVSLTGRVGFGGNNFSYVRLPGEDAFSTFYDDITWVAKSPDPAVGSFVLSLGDPRRLGKQATLFYMRHFINAQGQPEQTSGMLRLPDLSGNGVFDYSYFGLGLMMVSGDGTTIYPLGTTSSRPHGIRITLGATPSAALFDLPQGKSSVTSKPSFSNSTQIGECTLSYLANDYIGGPLIPTTSSFPRRRDEVLRADSERLSSTIAIIDFIGGELLTFETRVMSRELDHSVTETCVAGAVDWSGPSAQVKVNLQFSVEREKISKIVTDHVFANGTLQNVSDLQGVFPREEGITCKFNTLAGGAGPEPLVRGPFSFPLVLLESYASFSYSYNGFGPCPNASTNVISGADVGAPKRAPFRVLSDRAIDAVYREGVRNAAGQWGSVLKFRDITLDNGFLADASPIGEVFLATPDLSVIIHEPKPGNMPVLTRGLIPSGIVKLLAAVWM